MRRLLYALAAAAALPASASADAPIPDTGFSNFRP